MNRKGFVPIILLVAVVILVLAVGGYAYLKLKNGNMTLDKKSAAIPIQSNPTSTNISTESSTASIDAPCPKVDDSSPKIALPNDVVLNFFSTIHHSTDLAIEGHKCGIYALRPGSKGNSLWLYKNDGTEKEVHAFDDLPMFYIDDAEKYIASLAFSEGVTIFKIRNLKTWEVLFSTGQEGELREAKWDGGIYEFELMLYTTPHSWSRGKIDTKDWTIKWF